MPKETFVVFVAVQLFPRLGFQLAPRLQRLLLSPLSHAVQPVVVALIGRQPLP